MPENDLEFLARRCARLTDSAVPWVAEDEARMRDLAGLVAPPAPPAPPPDPPPPPPDPFASSPHQRLVLDERWAGDIDPMRWGLWSGPGHAKHGLRDGRQIRLADGVPGAVGRCLVITAEWLGRDAALARLASIAMSDADRVTVRAKIDANGGCTVSGIMGHRFDAPTGRYRWRVRAEPDPSAVTSPICMTWPQRDADWKAGHGENDVYEPGGDNTDRKPGHIYLHYAPENLQIPITVPVDCTEWHDVMFDRTRDALRVWYDRVLVADVRAPHPIFDHTGGWPHHVSIQLDAVKDTPLGAAQHFYVDEVQVWQP